MGQLKEKNNSKIQLTEVFSVSTTTCDTNQKAGNWKKELHLCNLCNLCNLMNSIDVYTLKARSELITEWINMHMKVNSFLSNIKGNYHYLISQFPHPHIKL